MVSVKTITDLELKMLEYIAIDENYANFFDVKKLMYAEKKRPLEDPWISDMAKALESLGLIHIEGGDTARELERSSKLSLSKLLQERWSIETSSKKGA